MFQGVVNQCLLFVVVDFGTFIPQRNHIIFERRFLLRGIRFTESSLAQRKFDENMGQGQGNPSSFLFLVSVKLGGFVFSLCCGTAFFYLTVVWYSGGCYLLSGISHDSDCKKSSFILYFAYSSIYSRLSFGMCKHTCTP